MATITDIIDLIHPASDALGVPIADTIWIVFDREIDETSVNEGNLFIEGPDTDSFIGPDMGLNLPNVSDSGSDDQLASPNYKGIMPGTISFQKINFLDLNLYTGPLDTTGAGNLWRTKAIFTPAFPFSTITNYRVYLVGDEDPSDTLHPTGIRSRTVFDGLTDVSNTGSGLLNFGGTYTGAANDTYHIQITIDGASGACWYEWWKDTDSLNIHGPILSDAYVTQSLDCNVTVKFSTGNFKTNDKYTVVVKTPQLFSDNTYWDFTSGSGSIIRPPSTTATSITGDPAGLIPTIFTVTSISPTDRSTNLPIITKRIILNFNDTIDPSTVTSDTISIIGQAVNGDETMLTTRDIYKDITVSGKKIIIDI